MIPARESNLREIPQKVTQKCAQGQGRIYYGWVIVGVCVITLGGFTGGAVGAWLGGHFFDLTKTYDMNFLVASVVMLISATLIWKARPSRVRIVRAVQAV